MVTPQKTNIDPKNKGLPIGISFSRRAMLVFRGCNSSWRKAIKVSRLFFNQNYDKSFKTINKKQLMEEILYQLIGTSLSHYVQGCIHPMWLFGISEPSTGTHPLFCVIRSFTTIHPSIHCGLSLPHRSRIRFPSTTTWRWTKSACNAHTWGVGGRSQTSCGEKWVSWFLLRRRLVFAIFLFW